MGNGKQFNLTDYAYRNGYYDQSHFIKDFKLFSGLTPKEYVLKYGECDASIDFGQ